MVSEYPQCHHSDPELLQRMGGEREGTQDEVHSTGHLGSWYYTQVLLWMASQKNGTSFVSCILLSP